MKTSIATLLLCLATICPAFAQVGVTQPWVRATVPQQRSTGAFMSITAGSDARLVEIRSAVAGVVEIHEMKMEQDVMTMRRVTGVDLPAGEAVEFKPGGYHVMLMDLSMPLKEGDSVPLTLVIEDKDGARQEIEVSAPVRPLHQRGGHRP